MTRRKKTPRAMLSNLKGVIQEELEKWLAPVDRHSGTSRVSEMVWGMVRQQVFECLGLERSWGSNWRLTGRENTLMHKIKTKAREEADRLIETVSFEMNEKEQAKFVKMLRKAYIEELTDNMDHFIHEKVERDVAQYLENMDLTKEVLGENGEGV